MLHTEPTVTIESLSNSGDGIARLDGRVVFVAGTAPGDTARVRVVADKRRHLEARLVELVDAGPDRVEPRCRHVGACGGCHWQHLRYTAQLEAKSGQLRETLVRIGALPDPPIAPVVACEHPFGYRNRIQGEIRAGRYHQSARGHGERVAIERCEIADEAINARIARGFEGVASGRVELALVEGGGRGGGHGGDESDVAVLPVDDARRTELGFRQVNASIEARLTELIVAGVGRTAAADVVDLYCGRGGWTCRLAGRFPERRVLGIDVLAENIRAAETTRRALALDNVTFVRARVEERLRTLPLVGGVCIVDPPRAGLDRAVVAALNDNPVQRLWYVSCHPATLARDLKALCTAGGLYRVERVTPLDMFPQTAHLECVAELAVAP